MCSSKGLVVVGVEAAGGAGLVGGLVVPDGCGEGEESLQDPHGDAGGAAGAVIFEAELVFEGPDDGFDDLAQRSQEPLVGAWRFCGGGGAIPTAGRGGAHCGFSANKSSILTYSATTRVSKSGFMPRSSRIGGCFHLPILDTLNPPNADPTP